MVLAPLLRGDRLTRRLLRAYFGERATLYRLKTERARCWDAHTHQFMHVLTGRVCDDSNNN